MFKRERKGEEEKNHFPSKSLWERFSLQQNQRNQSLQIPPSKSLSTKFVILQRKMYLSKFLHFLYFQFLRCKQSITSVWFMLYSHFNIEENKIKAHDTHTQAFHHLVVCSAMQRSMASTRFREISSPEIVNKSRSKEELVHFHFHYNNKLETYNNDSMIISITILHILDQL